MKKNIMNLKLNPPSILFYLQAIFLQGTFLQWNNSLEPIVQSEAVN